MTPTRRLRILMVTEDIPSPHVGGLGKHVVTLGNALIAQDHDVRLLGRRGRAYDEFRSDLAFAGDFVGGFDFAGMGWKEAAVGAWLPYKRIAMARRVERAIVTHGSDVDVVHYHGHLPMVGATLPRGINFVQTRHDQGSECITHMRFRGGQPCDALRPTVCAGCALADPGALREGISAFAVRQYRAAAARSFGTRKVVFVSEFLRRQFARAVPQADLTHSRVIHNFVSLDRVRDATRAAGSVRLGQVLLAARLDEAKGIGAFLDAFVPLLLPGQRVVVAGDGPQSAALRERYSGVDAVLFLGWRSHPDVLALTRESHVSVVPSICEEPCATTILEPLVLGRPVLALARGGTPELVRYERQAGQLRLEADMPALARAAAEALARPISAMPLPDDSAADVMHALPAILEVYAERGA